MVATREQSVTLSPSPGLATADTSAMRWDETGHSWLCLARWISISSLATEETIIMVIIIISPSPSPSPPTCLDVFHAREGEEWLKFSHYEIRQSEESRESLAWGTQPPFLSWYQANLCSIFRNMQFIFQDESKYWGWTRQGVTSCFYQIWLFLQSVALFGISGLFVSQNKTSQPVDLRIKLGAAAYSVEIPLNHNMKHFQINKPSLASGISIWGRRMREWVKIKFRLSLSRNQNVAPHITPPLFKLGL